MNQPPNLALKQERFRQQMTRTTLSQRTNLSRKCLNDVELRRTRVRFDTAARIATALGVPITDLFTETEVIG